MRPKMLWVLRHLIISAGLMWATGIPTGIITLMHMPDNADNMYGHFTPQDFATLEISPENYRTYSDSLKKDRSKLADNNQYTPFLYFRDLQQIRMFQIKFGHNMERTREGRQKIGSVEWGFVNELHNMTFREKNFFNNTGNLFTDIDKARAHWLHDGPNPNAPKFCWTTEIIFPILGWLLLVYLHGFPFAFVLFLIWKFNLKKDFEATSYRETLNVKRAPVSFGLSVLLWPLVLWIDIRNRWKQELRRTEVISRRDEMLSTFSKQEDLLLELSKKMSMHEFRAHLDSLGLTKKHSIAAAWCVTIFLIVVPTCLFPHTTAPLKKELTVMKKVDYGGGGIQKKVEVLEKITAAIFEDVIIVTEVFKQIFFITNWLYENDFSPDIGKVPWVVSQATYVTD